MPQVDFYVLTDDRISPERFACKLINKAWTQGNQIYVHTASKFDADRIDSLLWTFRDISFLPHALHTEDGQNDVPIVIGWQDIAPPGKQVMFNLAPTVPACVADFARVIEIVAADQEQKQMAREHYRQYQDRECDVHTHMIDASHD